MVGIEYFYPRGGKQRSVENREVFKVRGSGIKIVCM